MHGLSSEYDGAHWYLKCFFWIKVWPLTNLFLLKFILELSYFPSSIISSGTAKIKVIFWSIQSNFFSKFVNPNKIRLATRLWPAGSLEQLAQTTSCLQLMTTLKPSLKMRNFQFFKLIIIRFLFGLEIFEAHKRKDLWPTMTSISGEDSLKTTARLDYQYFFSCL